MLARINNTPVDYWLGLSLVELREWIKVHNQLAEEAEQKTRQRQQAARAHSSPRKRHR